MKNSKNFIKILLIVSICIATLLICTDRVNATGSSSSTTGGTETTTCTHAVYSTNSPGTYHYTYCKICGKCKSRARHTVSSTSNYR